MADFTGQLDEALNDIVRRLGVVETAASTASKLNAEQTVALATLGQRVTAVEILAQRVATLESRLPAFESRIAVLEARSGVGTPSSPPASPPASPPTSPPRPPTSPPSSIPPPPIVPPPVPPTVPPAVPPTKRILWKSPTNAPRGEGLRITKAGTYRWLGWDGYAQNVVVDTDGDVIFEDCGFLKAFRDTAEQQFVGQGLYVARARSVTAVRCLFAFNGCRDGDKAKNRNAYRHGWYHNVNGGQAVARDCVFAGNAACGLQTRADSETVACLFLGNAIGLCHVRGKHRSMGSMWFDGGRYAELDLDGDTIKAWTANTAIQSYAAIELQGAHIIGRIGQDAAQLPKSFDLGAVNLASGHRDNPGVTGSITGQNNVIRGWPGPPFSGARVHDGRGFTIDGRGPLPFDWRPSILEVVQGKSDLASAMSRIRQAAGGASA